MYERKDNINWDEYFMGVALLAAQRSKDPGTQVGACIVSEDKVILSTGYNGFVRGLNDAEHNWSRENVENMLGCKYDYVVHAEINAILNAGGKSLKGATLYTKLYPCYECAKAIIQAGVSEVVYLNDTATGNFKFNISEYMFNTVGVKVRQFKTDKPGLTVSFI